MSSFRHGSFAQRFEKMGDINAAWAAAFLEADGWFGIHSINGKSIKPTARIEATNTDRNLLDKLAVCLGVGKVYGPYAQRGLGTKPTFKYRLARQSDVWDVCIRLHPHMVSYKHDTVNRMLNLIADQYPRSAAA